MLFLKFIIVFWSLCKSSKFTFDVKNCSKAIKKIDMVIARDWWFLGKVEREHFLNENNTFVNFDEKNSTCTMTCDDIDEDDDLMFIIHLDDESFLDIRMFRIRDFFLKRNRTLQYHFKDKKDLFKNSSAFDFFDMDCDLAVKFTNFKFLN